MKNFKNLLFALACMIMFSSCYSYTSVVGNGPTEYKKETKWNHYFIAGLVPGSISDSKQMAKGSNDYSVKTRLTFGNYIVSFLTFGIYTPTTTTVKT